MNEELKERLIGWRRDFHRHPEQGFLEVRTASLVAAELTRLGFSLRTGRDVMVPEEMMGRPDAATVARQVEWARENGANLGFISHFEDGYTAITAEWDTGKPGPVTVFRVDMDALPIHENEDGTHIPAAQGFVSSVPGSMHACGHDAHTSIGLGLASQVAESADSLCGKIRIIFQPAEEGTRGAKSMAAAGVVDDADYFIASHVGTGVPHRQFVGAANGFLATTKLDVTFRGTASHAGAKPEEGSNALLAAANAAVNLHAISRHSGGTSRVNVGELHAGSGRNIIADRASMKIETRGETSDINSYVRSQAEAVLQGAALMYGVECKIEIVGEGVSSSGTPELAAALAELAAASPYIDHAEPEDNSSAGSEDATYFMERTKERGGQATYCIFGTDLAAGHHNEKFDINEETMFAAVDVLTRAALSLNAC